MPTPHADSIGKIAHTMRGQVEPLDAATLVRRAKEAEIPIGVQELLFIMQHLGPRGEGAGSFIPMDVIEFLAKLLESTSPPPKTMLLTTA